MSRCPKNISFTVSLFIDRRIHSGLTPGMSTAIVIRAFQVELSPSKQACFICFDESPLKVMENAFYFILKALFVLKIFEFLS